MQLSVVIPTYGRSQKLPATLEALFQSDCTDIPPPIEVIVVDDGSQPPVDLSLVQPPPNFLLRVLYQSNQGPGAARNTGFLHASGEVVLFLDDDVTLLPDALRRHYTAHKESTEKLFVLYGICPAAVEGFSGLSESQSQVPQRVSHVASGHLSLRKSLFSDGELPYASYLRTPVAEEYEMAYRLTQKGVPILLDSRIVGLHHIPPQTIEYFCKREYRHGLALGELMHKSPEALQLEGLNQILERNHPYRFRWQLSWLVKAVVVHGRLLRWLLAITRLWDRPLPSAEALSLWGRLLTGSALMAGIHAYLRQKPLS